MTKPKKLGFYHKSKNSNKKLIKLFEECQRMWFSSPKEWRDKNFNKKVRELEKQTRREISKMLKEEQIKTADDFYRAAFLFHHGSTFRSHALAVTLAATSYHLGELWGKGFYATTLDRFLLFIGQPQYFGTQFEKKNGKWELSPYNKKTTDKERKEYFVEPLKKALGRIKEFEREEKLSRK